MDANIDVHISFIHWPFILEMNTYKAHAFHDWYSHCNAWPANEQDHRQLFYMNVPTASILITVLYVKKPQLLLPYFK